MIKNLATIKNLTKQEISTILEQALFYKTAKKQLPTFSHQFANIFAEPSTRTLVSFKQAQRALKIENIDLSFDASSFKKGETLEDTLLTLEALNIKHFIIRSSEEFYWENWQHQHCFINGGDGRKNHPTQALLDALTIFEEFKTLENLKILAIGDIPHSRVTNSFIELMEKFNSQVDCFIPPLFGGENNNLDSQLGNYDVILMLRIQHERHVSQVNIQDYNLKWGLNKTNIKLLKKNAIFIHPGPINRDVEIASDLLYDHPKCRVLVQVNNGIFIRIAVLERLCKSSLTA